MSEERHFLWSTGTQSVHYYWDSQLLWVEERGTQRLSAWDLEDFLRRPEVREIWPWPNVPPELQVSDGL